MGYDNELQNEREGWHYEQPASAAGSESVPQRLSLTDDYEGVVSEFDKVFAEMEAPDYPATCDNCGAEGTNATMEQHECQLPAPAAPETGEVEPFYGGFADDTDMIKETSRVLSEGQWFYTPDQIGHCDLYAYDGHRNTYIGRVNKLQHAQEIIKGHNSHHSLIAEWERLVEALKQIHAALPNGIRLTPTETKIATIVADALSDINQKGSGSE